VYQYESMFQVMLVYRYEYQDRQQELYVVQSEEVLER
jgi:hypothetical protein